MNKKIILGIIAFLLLGLIFVVAQEQKSFEYRVILNCKMEGHSDEVCDILVGNMFEISLKEGEEQLRSYVVFPEDFEEQLDMRSYPRELVNCEDPTQITVAKLVDGSWQAVTERIPKIEQMEGSGLQVEVLIEEEGIYGVVQESVGIHKQLSAAGIDTGQDRCMPLDCGDFKAYSTDPYSGQVEAGNSISFKFCDMVPGCQAGADESCSSACLEGSDPNCPALCTNEPGDCCDPSLDNVCDEDCWINKTTLFGEKVIYDAVDPDCLKGSYVENYVELDEYEELENHDDFEPIEITGMVRQGRSDFGHTPWTPFEKMFDEKNPKLLEGPIRFTITNKESEGVWFRDFTYIDLQGEEHKLFPLHPMPLERGAIDKSGFSVGEIFVENADKKDMQEIMIAYPHLFFLTQKDSEVDGGKGKIQFELPPTGVKGIKFFAASDEDTVRTEFKVSIGARKGNGDTDGDGYDNYIDCHDANPSIHPGAQELCNQLDDDCDSFHLYDKMMDKTAEQIETLTGEDPWRDSANWEYEKRVSEHYLMPCDGFIQFRKIKAPSFLEVWKKEECSSTDSFVSCDAAGANGIWNSYYATLAYGGRTESGYTGGVHMEQFGSGISCHGWNRLGLACGGCGEEEPCHCVIGSHSSCQIGALPSLDACDADAKSLGKYRVNLGNLIENSQAKFNYWKSGKEIISEWNDYAGDGQIPEYNVLDEINTPENRVELNKGEMLWGHAWKGCPHCHSGIDSDSPGWSSSDCDKGKIAFDIYCYPEKIIDEKSKDYNDYVDEGVENCQQKEIEDTVVHVCSTEWFDFDKKECMDETLCSFTSKNYSGGCEYLTQEPELQKEFYTYVCKEGEECYLFYKENFDVCTQTEVCDHNLNIDSDCDGLRPYEPTCDNPEALTDLSIQCKGDPRKPKDPDCEGKAQTGTCNLEDKTWFDGEEWVAESYCLQCGDQDSTCQKLCEEDEASCEGGCWQDACDISANKWCNEGAWTDANYCEKCGTSDYDCYSSVGKNCETGACEIVENRSCFMGSWVKTDTFGDYCESQRCNSKDSDCNVECEEGTCDIHGNQYCLNGQWTSQDYCQHCGAQDYDCGSIACTEGTCDYLEKKVCQSGSWIAPTKDNYCWTWNCAEVDKDYCTGCIVTEGQEEAETNCFDGIDNDCDGYTDCRDPDCADLPECSMPPCTPGTEQSCGTNVGWCELGTQTCQDNGQWGECLGNKLPETEICNSVDDDCDGSIDEGCMCADGETRLCGQELGSCSMGIQNCVDGQWGLCFGSSFALPEAEVCDGVDNDCDGSIDEGCGCIVGETQECGTDVGICEIGTQTCMDDGHWGPCKNGTMPLPEICGDGLDNDCDGFTDKEDDACSVTESLAPTCFDGIKNQNEEQVDCGGECAPCSQTTCNDRKKNGNEEGIDCGGDCPPCTDEIDSKMGMNDESDYEEDTEFFMQCGDGICDEGEDCPADCEEGSSIMSWIIPILIFLALIGGGFFAYKKGLIKIKGKDSGSKKVPRFKPKKNQFSQPMFKQRPSGKKKKYKSKQEQALEKSMKEHKDILKK